MVLIMDYHFLCGISYSQNEPVAYKRANTLLMDVVVECNRTPYHDFQYWIIGSGGSGQGSYTTAVCEGHFNGTNLSTVEDIVPRDGPFPDSVGIIDPLNYHWYANKGANADPSDFKYLNSSSHKIYLTYDTPLLSPVNILALDKICSYAQNQYNQGTIAASTVDGVYDERWTYDPGHEIFTDPLDVIRLTIGQCGDYANLLTYLYRSVGLPANSTVIFNGATFGPIDYVLLWHLTGTPPNERGVLLSELLESCDGISNEWYFSYHAASSCANHICDAALGQFRSPSDYNGYWKYYLHPKNPNPPYYHDEPPPFEPSYYDWIDYLPPYPENILPGYRAYDSGFNHPGP